MILKLHHTIQKFTSSTVWVAILLKVDFEYFPWQLLQFCSLIFTLAFGEDNDETRDGEIMGEGVLEMLWENAEFLTSDFFPSLVGFLAGLLIVEDEIK